MTRLATIVGSTAVVAVALVWGGSLLDQHSTSASSSIATTSSASPSIGSEMPSEPSDIEPTGDAIPQQPETGIFLSKIRADETVDGFVGWTDFELDRMARQSCITYEHGVPFERLMLPFTQVGIDTVYAFYFLSDASEVYCPAMYDSVKEMAGF